MEELEGDASKQVGCEQVDGVGAHLELLDQDVCGMAFHELVIEGELVSW